MSRKRPSKFSTRDYRELAYKRDKWGAIFIKLGERDKLERQAGDFPDLMERLRAFFDTFTFDDLVVERTNKLLIEFSADEQIKLGRGFKDFSCLLTAAIDNRD
ncbi:MAG: hypothetical protein ACP5E9_07460 [Candidatus Methanospirareceae archaeon]